MDPKGKTSRLIIYTTWGQIHVMATNGCVVACRLPRLRRVPRRPFRWHRAAFFASHVRDRQALTRAHRYLRQMLAGKRAVPPPLAPLAGTHFMRQIWRKLAEIPMGTQITYGKLATEMGCVSGSRAARAVGNACRANPLPLFIPCHRVVSADGTLGGFSAGVAWKRLVLEREGVKIAARSAIRTGANQKGNRIR